MSATMADLQRIESMQYPAGHLAHLSDQQQEKLNEFRQLCEEQNYYTPATGAKAASHDDETLLYGQNQTLRSPAGY